MVATKSQARQFQFEQATLLIHDCTIYSVQMVNGKGVNCLEIFEQLIEWTRERYTGPEEAVQAIRDARHIREVYVPVFAVAANAETLDREQKALVAAALTETLDKMAGLRGELAYEDESRAEQFIRFMVDAMVSSAVAGVESKRLIGYLNDMSQRFDAFRLSYDLAVKARIRFLIDYASAAVFRKLEFEEKTHHLSTVLFRPFSWETRMSSAPRHSGGGPFLERLAWRREAEKLIIDKPLLVVLEGLLQNMNVKVADQIEIVIQDSVIGTQDIYRLDEMGQWAAFILTRLGYDIEETPRGGKKDHKADFEFSDCERVLVPVSVTN